MSMSTRTWAVAAFVIASLAMCSAGYGQDSSAGGPLASWNLAQLPDKDLSADGWGQAKSEGERKFRIAAKGGVRSFNVKPWWTGQSLRPPEGQLYALEVSYQDTLPAPAGFLVHAALGKGNELTLLHYIGGAADGKWKTALVPLSWDYVALLPEARDKVGFAVKADADLAIADVVLRKAAPDDPPRHFAELRGWVAAVQQSKKAAAASQAAARPAKTATKPQFLEKNAPLVAFPWPAMVPLTPDRLPKDEMVGGAVKVRMCGNEMENASFGIYAGKELAGVTYSVSELTDGDRKFTGTLMPRTAEYCLVQSGGGLRPFPQRLWPAYAVDVPAGQTQWFVINVSTQRGKTQPGTYKGAIHIAAGADKVDLPLEVEVLNVDLLSMEEAGLLMGGCVTGLLSANDIAFQRDYNQNMVNLWFSGVRPGMQLKDGKLVLDFEYLDEWMASAKKRGCQAIVWFLGGDPYGFPMTMTICRDLSLLDTKGKPYQEARLEWVKRQTDPANRDKILPETRPLLVEWARQVDQHARAAGWPELILTPFDEPAKWVQKDKKNSDFPGVIGTGTWIKPFFKDACAAIRQGAPKVRIYGSIHHNRLPQEEGIIFLDDINVFCTNAIHEDPLLGQKVRQAGKDFWQYSGTGNAADSPERARYAFGFFFGAYDSRGSLCWAYNWGAGLDTTSGSNWMYAWQTPYGTIPAPYFEGMREAWDDRRVIETYKKAFANDKDAMAALETIFKEATASRASGGRDTVSDFWAGVDDVAKLDRWRGVLLDRLVKSK